jgi:hypothetical protein
MNRTEHPVSRVVPDGYRARRLPDRVREWVDDQAHRLNQLYHQYEANEEVQREDFRGKKESTFESGDWNWYGKGSERDVGGLGKTLNGEPVFDTFEAVVIKFNLTKRPVDGPVLTRDEQSVASIGDGNLHELAIWKWACDHGDEDWFATIYDYSEYGDWIAQQYHIPIYASSQRPAHARNGADHIVDHNLPIQYKRRMEDRGYDPHIKDGNVGVDPDEETVVCIDFGSHFDIDDMDIGDLFDYTLND